MPSLSEETEAVQLSMDNSHLPLYKSHSCDNTYTLMSGTFALPVAEDPPSETDTDEDGNLLLSSWSPLVIVQAYAPYRVRKTLFQTKKEGGPPLIPTPKSAGAFKFTEGELLFSAPQLNADGRSYTWEVSGVYEFVETVRSDYADGFVLTSLPNNTIMQMRAYREHGNAADNKQPKFGAIAQAGEDARMGYIEAQKNIDLESSEYTYNNPAYFPAEMLHDGLVNGTVTFPATLSGSGSISSSLTG